MAFKKIKFDTHSKNLNIQKDYHMGSTGDVYFNQIRSEIHTERWLWSHSWAYPNQPGAVWIGDTTITSIGSGEESVKTFREISGASEQNWPNRVTWFLNVSSTLSLVNQKSIFLSDRKRPPKYAAIKKESGGWKWRDKRGLICTNTTYCSSHFLRKIGKEGKEDGDSCVIENILFPIITSIESLARLQAFNFYRENIKYIKIVNYLHHLHGKVFLHYNLLTKPDSKIPWTPFID